MSFAGQQLGLFVGDWLGGVDAGSGNLSGTASGSCTVSGSLIASSAQAGVRGKRRRVVVEINGRIQFVRDEREALTLIDRARDEIREEIKSEPSKYVRVVKGRLVAKKQKVRVVTGGDTLKHHAAYVTQEVNRAIDVLFEALLREAQEQDDEEVLLLS